MSGEGCGTAQQAAALWKDSAFDRLGVCGDHLRILIGGIRACLVRIEFWI